MIFSRKALKYVLYPAIVVVLFGIVVLSTWHPVPVGAEECATKFLSLGQEGKIDSLYSLSGGAFGVPDSAFRRAYFLIDSTTGGIVSFRRRNSQKSVHGGYFVTFAVGVRRFGRGDCCVFIEDNASTQTGYAVQGLDISVGESTRPQDMVSFRIDGSAIWSYSGPIRKAGSE
jgi:hypothetical protein